MRRNELVERLFLLAILIAGCFLIVGCSGSSLTTGGMGNETSSSNAGAGSNATVAEEKREEEEGGITESDIVGIWKTVEIDGDRASTSEMEDKGLFTCYKFEEGGKMVMSIQAYDSSLDREGTYEIRDGKLYVSAPALDTQDANLAQATDGQIKSIKARAIKDAEVKIEDGYLVTNQISTDGKESKAKKITDEQYKLLVKKASALGPEKVAVGQEVSADGYQFTVNSLSYEDEVYPSDLSGYYRYYEHQDGKSYLVADVSFTNLGTEYAVPGYSTKALVTVGGNKYDANIEVDGGSNMSPSYSVEAKDAARVLVFAAIPDAARDSGEATITWSFPTNPGMMNSYYQSSGSHTNYVISEG